MAPGLGGRDLRRVSREALTAVGRSLGAGPTHRRRLADIDTRVVVSGVRGKTTMVRWLYEVFSRRGYDTFAKITGDRPRVLYDGVEHEVSRVRQVRLYENERELERFGDVEVAIVENQGIREYTTRLVNEQFVDPHVVFITNVREDHLDTLGRNRTQIARSLARSVPRGTDVITGEQNAAVRTYLDAELERRDASVTHVDLPPESRAIPGAECVYGLDAVLEAVGQPPVSPAEREAKLASRQPRWRHLSGGRVYNAADVNDVQSTELIRRSLVGDSGDVVRLLLNLRHDRRGRTVSFLRYVEELVERDAVERVHVVGDDRRLFKRNASFPVRCHDTDSTTPEALLRAILTPEYPVLVVGNSISEFMHELERVVDDFALDEAAGESRSTEPTGGVDESGE